MTHKLASCHLAPSLYFFTLSKRWKEEREREKKQRTGKNSVAPAGGLNYRIRRGALSHRALVVLPSHLTRATLSDSPLTTRNAASHQQC